MQRSFVVGVVALALAVATAGCSRVVGGSGQPAARSAPVAAVAAEPAATPAATPEPSQPSATAEPTSPTSPNSPTAPTASAEPSEPAADAARGEIWRYADGLGIALVGVVPYASTEASVEPDEYAVKLTYEVTNEGSSAVKLTASVVAGECVGGAKLVDADDDSLAAPKGKLAAGAAATYESGVAVQQAGQGQRCTVEITPSAAYEPARFVFTAPHG